MEIKKAVFLSSEVDLKKCPSPTMHEYAFIGRSNVGKSSLINMLTRNGKLAHTSSSPGKTQTINHYSIDEAWYLVDLPGYGYAKVSKDKRLHFEKFIRNYILERKNMMCLFVLIDIRIEAQKIDLEFMTWLGTNGVPFGIVFTKSDKITKSKISLSVDAYKEVMLESWEELPPMFITSSETRLGRDELLNYIDSLNQLELPVEEEPIHEAPKKTPFGILDFTLEKRSINGKELIYKKVNR